MHPVFEAHETVVGDGTVEKTKFNKSFLIGVTILSTIGAFLFGYDTGIVSGSMIFIKDEFNLNHFWFELIVSITIFSAWVFSICAGFMADLFGRKRVILVSSIIFVIGSVILGVAISNGYLLAGRLIVGIGIGLASMIVPVYNAEISPKSLRGRLVALNQTFICFGQFSAAVVAGIFSYNEKNGWRYMLGLAAIPAAIQFVGFFFMPESPRYLVKKGKNERALKILKRTQPQNSHVEKELEEIKKNCEDTNASQDSPFTVLQRIFKTPTVRKALFVGCCLQIFQQIVGINTVMYYTATIIEISGVKDKSTAIWLSSLVAFVPLICNFSSFYFIEKLGRRITLLFSLTGVVLSLFVIGAAFQVIDSSSPQIKWQNEIELLNRSHVSSLKCINVNRDADCNLCISYAECGVCYEVNDNYVKMSCLPIDFNTNTTTEFGMCQNGTLSEQRIFWNSDECPNFQKKIYSILIVAGLMSYLFFYAFGLGPVPWVMNTEIYPMWARSVCGAMATSMNWLFNLIISMTFLTLIDLLSKAGAFFLYACFGVIGLLLFYKILPETKGISLEETETLFIQCSKEKPSSSIKPPA